jgi:phosphate transport system permease protein
VSGSLLADDWAPGTAFGASPGPGFSNPAPERPKGRTLPAGEVREFVGSLVAAVAAVGLIFSVAGEFPLFGMFVCTLLIFLVIYGVLSWRLHGVLEMKSRLGTVYVWGGGALALIPLVDMVLYIVIRGAPVALSHFPAFLVHDAVGGPDEPVWKVGVGNAIVGSFMQVGLATLYTVPVSILTATYLSEHDSWFSRLVRTVVDAMMGMPSIIAGLFVYVWWVQPKHQNGTSGFAASIALAIVMLPIMIRTAEEVIRVVPGSLREAALALGAPRWRVTLSVVLPTAKTGLITACILGVAIGVGETAPVLFTALGSPFYNWNPFHGPQADLPLQIYSNITSSAPNLKREGYGGAFVLVTLVLTLFTAARIIGSSKPGRWRRRRNKEVVPE